MEDYLLEPCDLEGLEVHYIRSAYSETGKRERGFMKLDIEQRALKKWGTWTDLKRELEKRREIEEEVERRRKGFSAIIAHLKSSQKQLNRREVDDEAYGGEDTRKSMLKGSATVVAYAIISNFVVMVMKWVAYVHTGSAAMLSETIHSLVDMLNQCLLAIGILSSIQQPDPDHPYGFSRARYVYSLISGVGFFFLGAGVTMYHGIMALLSPPVLESMPVAFSVLGGSFLVEGLTLLAAIRQVRKSAIDSGVTFKDYVLRGKDPSAVAVLMEDSAAVTGVLIASASILLTHVTGNHMYDAMGSIAIGGLLGAVALFLIQRNSDALVGRTMHPRKLKEIVELLESDQVIHSVHDIKATDMGADSVRFKAEINVDGREVTRVHLSRLDLEAVLKEVQNIKTVSELERFLLEHGEHVVDKIGDEIDRVEIRIKKHSPDVRHIDLEII
jgi:zinc transporter 9